MTTPAPLALTPLVLPPVGSEDYGRVDEMRLRWRLLYGQHETDVKEAIRLSFGLVRASVMEWVDVAANSYVQLWTTLSALYLYPARARGPDALVLAAVERNGHWQRMVRTQRDVLAQREQFLLLSWDADSQTLQERVVPPHLFEGLRPLRVDPTRLGAISCWLRAGRTWERHSYQIEEEDGTPMPAYRVTDPGGKIILEESGDAYTFRDAAGLPIIPGVLYHAQETGTLLDWETGRDISRGAVRLMVFYTGAGHVIIDASWAQRYSVGVNWTGRETQVDGRSVIVADPATVLEGTVDPASPGTVMVGAFPQPADPEAVMRTIAMYSRQLAASAGVRSPEATRTESDIRSGYSLAVSREAVQEMQASFAPTFRRADRQYLHVAACLMGSPSLGPEEWSVDYQALTMSPIELNGRLSAIKTAREAGLMSRVDAVLFLYPQLTVVEAQAKIDSGEMDAEPALIPTPPTSVDTGAPHADPPHIPPKS